MAETLDFKEIAAMMDHLPPPRSSCYQMVGGVKPPYKDILNHLGGWQTGDESLPTLKRPRVCLFAASHGVVANSVEVTQRRVQSTQSGKALVNELCSLADAELRVYELDVENPTQDITQGDAMTEEEAVRTIAYGMMAVEPGVDVIVLGSVGEGVEIATKKIVQALSQKSIPEKNTDAAPEVLSDQALTSSDKLCILDVLNVLRAQGGYDLCAMVGAAIAARMAGVPILIDNVAGDAVKQVLETMKQTGGDHLYSVEGDLFFDAPHPFASLTVLPQLKTILKTVEMIHISTGEAEIKKSA